MLSTVGTALETYGLIAGAAINRQAENTQIRSQSRIGKWRGEKSQSAWRGF
jgi:hypothetical protein